MLLSVNFFGIGVMRVWLSGIYGFLAYMLYTGVLYLFFCGLGFSKGNYHGYFRPILWIEAGLLLSFVAAYIFYGQTFFQSIICSRLFAPLLTAPVLICINPTYKEIRKALYSFVIIDFIMTLYVTFVDQSLVFVPEGMDFLVGKEDLVRSMPGLHFTAIAFAFAVNDYIDNNSSKYLMRAIMFYIILIINMNRTLMFAGLVIALFSIISAGTRRKQSNVLISFLVVSFVVGFAAINVFRNLYNETTQQLGDMEYNRIKSIIYMFSCPNGPLSYVIGNGFISGKVNTLVQDLFDAGIFYSDVGFIGFWNQFGIITTGAILYYLIRGLRREHSFIVKASAIIILCSSLTVAYFTTVEKLCWLSFYFMLYYQDLMSKPELMYSRKKQNRYRSLAA